MRPYVLGHAVSRDPVRWHEVPVAIPEQGDEMVFSGGAVVDKDNTSGRGTRATAAPGGSAMPAPPGGACPSDEASEVLTHPPRS